jgi:3-dehydroquinate dehydratase / shikimate dehydrogenase
MPDGEVAITTERLLLRAWRASDRPAFAALNADPRVMEWFPGTLSRERSDEMADAIAARLLEAGWGLWAVEVPGVADFIGFVGLNRADDVLGWEAVEVGWRLAAEQWGRGYAPEAARAALAFGFDTLGLDEIVSLTSVGNVKSRRVMEKLGMTYDPHDDFENPRIAEGSPLRAHVLYRLGRATFAGDTQR